MIRFCCISSADRLIEGGECIGSVVLHLEDLLPTIAPCFQTGDQLKTCQQRFVRSCMLRTLSSNSSACLKSFSMTLTSASSALLVLSPPNFLCIDFISAVATVSVVLLVTTCSLNGEICSTGVERRFIYKNIEKAAMSYVANGRRTRLSMLRRSHVALYDRNEPLPITASNRVISVCTTEVSAR